MIEKSWTIPNWEKNHERAASSAFKTNSQRHGETQKDEPLKTNAREVSVSCAAQLQWLK
jgi:hypothetical protein